MPKDSQEISNLWIERFIILITSFKITMEYKLHHPTTVVEMRTENTTGTGIWTTIQFDVFTCTDAGIMQNYKLPQ